MIIKILLLTLSFSHAAEPEKIPPHVQQEYQEAFQYFSHGEYPKAVLKWEQILQESPTQMTARTMISKARSAIWKVTRDRQKKINDLVAAGQYEKAEVELQPFLDVDPDDPRLESFHQRLQNIVDITPAMPVDDRAAHAAAIGVSGYLDFDPDYQLAYDGLRYAIEKSPDNALYRRFVDLLLSEQPRLSNDAVTPGMKLIDYKQHIALGDIYDARYSDAIKTLVDVIRLEPENVVGWERLGSAYYCLGLKAKAATAWKEALRISPADPGLKKFLNKKKPLKCG